MGRAQDDRCHDGWRMRAEGRPLLFRSFGASLLLHLLTGVLFWTVQVPAPGPQDPAPLMVRLLPSRDVPRFIDQPDAPRANTTVRSRDISQVTSEARGPGRAPGPITSPGNVGSPDGQGSQPPADDGGGGTRPAPHPEQLPLPSYSASDPSLRPSLQEQVAALGRGGRAENGTLLDAGAEGNTGTGERIVSLETRSVEFAPYLAEVKRRIERQWYTPSYARAIGLTGKLVLVFSIAPDGDLARIEIAKSSGTSILDSAAVTAVREAAPYGPFPPTFTFQRLTIFANFEYVDTASPRQPR